MMFGKKMHIFRSKMLLCTSMVTTSMLVPMSLCAQSKLTVTTTPKIVLPITYINGGSVTAPHRVPSPAGTIDVAVTLNKSAGLYQADTTMLPGSLTATPSNLSPYFWPTNFGNYKVREGSLGHTSTYTFYGYILYPRVKTTNKLNQQWSISVGGAAFTGTGAKSSPVVVNWHLPYENWTALSQVHGPYHSLKIVPKTLVPEDEWINLTGHNNTWTVDADYKDIDVKWWESAGALIAASAAFVPETLVPAAGYEFVVGSAGGVMGPVGDAIEDNNEENKAQYKGFEPWQEAMNYRNLTTGKLDPLSSGSTFTGARKLYPTYWQDTGYQQSWQAKNLRFIMNYGQEDFAADGWGSTGYSNEKIMRGCSIALSRGGHSAADFQQTSAWSPPTGS